ncbi:hypothetical protein [Prosthecobacter sp.]
MLLPLALAVRWAIKPRPDTLQVAQGILRFCAGFAKAALLVIPLWHLSSMILRGGAESLTVGVAWIGLLALMLGLHFVCTSAGDLVAGLGGMLGWKVSDEVQEIFTLRRFTRGKHIRLLPFLAILALFGMLLQTLSPTESWGHLKALFVAPPKTIATAFQEARVWSDYHVVTMLGALACFIGVPHSRDFLRVPAPWKAVFCLVFFVLAVAIQWTRNAPMS